MLFVKPQVRIRTIVLGSVFFFVLLVGILAWDVASGEGFTHLGKVGSYFSSTVTDVLQDEGTYAQRHQVDAMRYPLVRQRPWLGHGFISPFGVAYQMWRTQGVLAIDTTDTGWLDLMIRFGFMGAILIAVLMFVLWRTNYRMLRRPGLDLPTRAMLLANMQFFLAVVIMVITAAPFTIEFNITAISLIIMRTMYLEYQLRTQMGQTDEDPAAQVQAL